MKLEPLEQHEEISINTFGLKTEPENQTDLDTIGDNKQNVFKIQASIPKKTQMFGCQFCDKTYKHKDSLRVHTKIHTRENLHKCSMCDKEFTAAKYLRKHMDLHDSTKVKELCICAYCNKQYKQKDSLRVHMKIHARVNLHKCSVCLKEFTVARNLRKHIETHARRKLKGSSKKQYNCTWENCNRIFESEYAFKYHMLVHKSEKPYNCSICDKGFRMKHMLNLHLKVNHDPQAIDEERPYACTWENCNKRFTSPQGLRYHMQVHNEEKPFNCSLCHQGFRTNYLLKRHWQKKHDSTITNMSPSSSESTANNMQNSLIEETKLEYEKKEVDLMEYVLAKHIKKEEPDSDETTSPTSVYLNNCLDKTVCKEELTLCD